MFRLSQVYTRYGCFGRFLFRIQRDDNPGLIPERRCAVWRSVNRPEDTVVEHTVEVCPVSAEHRCVPEVIGGGHLSHPALVEAMVRGGAEA